MVAGLNVFKEFFAEDTDKYVLIGGAACDTVFASAGASFRATKDLDLVLVVEALTPEFGRKFWQFIDAGGYENRNTTAGKPQFFRFTKPKDERFPVMIELFARTEFPLRAPNTLTPIHLSEEIASLSGILLNADYYQVLLQGRAVVNGLSVLRPEYLILFKAKAYLDLKGKRDAGESVHYNEYSKHKRDILRITVEMELQKPTHLPKSVLTDISAFLSGLDTDPFDETTLRNYGLTTSDAAERLSSIFQ